MHLKDSHIVITGASRGLGASLARELAGRGAKVTLLARNAQLIKALATELDGHAVVVDLSLPDELDGLIDRIEDEVGPVDALISNAAVNLPGEFAGQTPDEIRSQIQTNLVAPLLLSNQVIPRMIARGSGNLMIVSSVSGEIATRNNSCYATSKAGLNRFVGNIRRELRRTPVHVGVTILGEMNTDMSAQARQDPLCASVASRVGFFGSLEPTNVAVKIAHALELDRKALVMPMAFAPTYYLRQAPNLFADAIMWRID